MKIINSFYENTFFDNIYLLWFPSPKLLLDPPTYLPTQIHTLFKLNMQ